MKKQTELIIDSPLPSTEQVILGYDSKGEAIIASISESVNQEPIVIPGYEAQTPPDLSIEIPTVEQINTEPVITIYDTYDWLIKQYEDGSIRNFTYPMALDILRHCEKKVGSQIPLNMGCATCLMDLVKLFINLK